MHDFDSTQLRVRHSGRARRLSMRVLHDHVEVVVPPGMAQLTVEQFVADNQRWVKQRLNELQHTDLGNEFPPHSINLAALNESWGCQFDTQTAVIVLTEQQQRAPEQRLQLKRQAAQADVREALMRWLHQRCLYYFNKRVAELSQQCQLGYRKVAARNQVGRWGSCNAYHDISLNIKLAFFATEVVDYVIIHELCHTEHANHSRQFWQLVARHCPDYKQLSGVLRREAKTVPRWLYD